MRKLKFRVWSGNMWLDGNDANIHAVNSDETDIELVASYPHKNLIMCQWTGLLDRHGKEIYEGDIVVFSMPQIPSLKREPKEVYWNQEACSYYLRRPNYKGYGNDFNSISSEYEILGNIFETPSFIKKGKKNGNL